MEFRPSTRKGEPVYMQSSRREMLEKTTNFEEAIFVRGARRRGQSWGGRTKQTKGGGEKGISSLCRTSPNRHKSHRRNKSGKGKTHGTPKKTSGERGTALLRLTKEEEGREFKRPVDEEEGCKGQGEVFLSHRGLCKEGRRREKQY